MSVRALDAVLRKYPGSGPRLLCLICLADWSNDQGGSLYPSISSVAIKMRVDRRNAQRAIAGLIEEGFLHVVGNMNGGARGSTRHYQIDMVELMGLPDVKAKLTSDKIVTGDKTVVGRVAKSSRTGGEIASQTVREPLENQSISPSVAATRNRAVPNVSEGVIELFHQHCQTLPKIKLLTDSRRQAIRNRWMQAGRDLSRYDPKDVEAGIVWWSRFFEAVDASNFLSGRSGRFRCTFDWLTKQGNFIKVVEGCYENGESAR